MFSDAHVCLRRCHIPLYSYQLFLDCLFAWMGLFSVLFFTYHSFTCTFSFGYESLVRRGPKRNQLRCQYGGQDETWIERKVSHA